MKHERTTCLKRHALTTKQIIGITPSSKQIILTGPCSLKLLFLHYVLCTQPLMDGECFYQIMGAVFNNQLCVQFSGRLMLHEGMSYLPRSLVQMGLGDPTRSRELLSLPQSTGAPRMPLTMLSPSKLSTVSIDTHTLKSMHT